MDRPLGRVRGGSSFALWKTLEGWQKCAGLGNSPRTLLEEIGRMQVVDVVMPLVDGPELRLRCVTEPDAGQKVLLERLGLKPPKRLRLPEALSECSGKTAT